MEKDIVIHLPNGTEISIEAACGDIDRACALLDDFADDAGMAVGGAIADLMGVRELVLYLAARVAE